MEKWEKIILALDEPDRTARARNLFDLMEDERREGVRDFRSYGLSSVMSMVVRAKMVKTKERLVKMKAFDAAEKMEKCLEQVDREDAKAEMQEREARAAEEKQKKGVRK